MSLHNIYLRGPESQNELASEMTDLTLHSFDFQSIQDTINNIYKSLSIFYRFPINRNDPYTLILKLKNKYS